MQAEDEHLTEDAAGYAAITDAQGNWLAVTCRPMNGPKLPNSHIGVGSIDEVSRHLSHDGARGNAGENE